MYCKAFHKNRHIIKSALSISLNYKVYNEWKMPGIK